MAVLVLAAAVVALLTPTTFSGIRATVISPLLGVIMFGMGMSLSLNDFRIVFSRPRDVLIGCAAQFTVMPLLAFLLSRLFALDEALAIGVILVGCCPGGTASNVITFLAKGDLALSVGMTATSTLLAPLLTPFLVWLLAGKTVDVDVVGMLLSILWVVILPIVAGLIVKWLWPRLTERAGEYLPAVSSLAIAFIVLIIIAANASKLLAGGLVIIVVVILHNLFGLSLGWLIGRLLRLPDAKRRAVSIEVGMQNSGLASSLATIHFAAYPMATIPGAIFSVWHNISGTIVARLYIRNMKILRIFILLLLLPMSALGQPTADDGSPVVTHQPTADDGSPVVTHQPTTGGHTVITRLRQVQQFLDQRAKKKVDPSYIEVPDKPWRVIARYKENAVQVDYENSTDFPETNETLDMGLRFEPPVAASVGFWVGYRGTGIGFSKSLAKNAGRYYSISTTGAKYGFNFRLRRFSTDETTLTATDYKDGMVEGSPVDTTLNMPAPVWIRSVYLNGYYVFNGRRYSQAAAYNQSVIQRRSAGSFLLGATWYQSSFDFSDPYNITVILLSHNVGKIKVHQANVGLGYGYNWVPFRGFVVNAMAMPTVNVYNRVKVYKYDCNYALPTGKPVTDNYGQWDKTTRRWENGETHKPIVVDEKTGDFQLNQFDFWDADSESSYSAFRVNLDLRIGMAYNWSNYFVGIQAQYNNFNYKKDQGKVNLFDAYARFSLGVRL